MSCLHYRNAVELIFLFLYKNSLLIYQQLSTVQSLWVDDTCLLHSLRPFLSEKIVVEYNEILRKAKQDTQNVKCGNGLCLPPL